MATTKSRADEPAPTPLRAPSCAITCAADEGLKAQSKTWNQIAVAGAFRGHSAGAFEFTTRVFRELIANLAAQSNGAVAVDYEHTSETLEGSVAQAGAPAVAWVTALELRADGRELWGLFEWVDGQAVEYVRAGRYRYLSPAIVFHARDRVTGKPVGAAMSSVALTNNPFLLHMQPLAASARAEPETTTMADTQNTAQPDALASELAALKAERDKLAADNAALAKSHAETKATNEKLQAEQAAALRRDALETVAALTAAGAITGDEAIDAAVELYLSARPTFAKLYGAQLAALRKPAGKAAELTARFPGLAALSAPPRASAEVAALLKGSVSAEQAGPKDNAGSKGPVDTTVMPYGDAIEAVAANLRAKNKDLNEVDSYRQASALLKQHGRTG
jgi:phage I-like protein